MPKTKWECLAIVKGSEDNNIGNGTGNANKGREAKRTPLEPGSPVHPEPSEFFLTPPLQGTWPTLPVNDLMVAADALWRMQLKNWCKSAYCTAIVFRKLVSEERWSLCILFMCLEFGYNVFELFVNLGSVITSLELPGDSLVLDTHWQAEEARVTGLMEDGGSSDGQPCLSPVLFLSRPPVERCYSIQGCTHRHIQRCVS